MGLDILVVLLIGNVSSSLLSYFPGQKEQQYSVQPDEIH